MTREEQQPPSSPPASQVEGPPDFAPVGGAELRSDVTNIVVAPVGSIEINPEEARHGSLEERMPLKKCAPVFRHLYAIRDFGLASA